MFYGPMLLVDTIYGFVDTDVIQSANLESRHMEYHRDYAAGFRADGDTHSSEGYE